MRRLHYHYLTLVELIIAMAIFTVILLVLATMLNGTLKLSRKRRNQADIFQQQQVLSTIFSRDLQNMVTSTEPEQEIYWKFSQSAIAFVTTATAGVDYDGSIDCPLNGVMYTLDSDSTLCRGILSLDTPYPGPNINWVTSITDSDVLARNVKTFSLLAFLPDGTQFGGLGEKDPPATGKRPVLINMKVELQDEHDTDRNDGEKPAYRTYEKRIFIPRDDL